MNKSPTLETCLRISTLPLHRARALCNYVMALAAHGHTCKHPVELTLTPFCHYTYSNLTKVVTNLQMTDEFFQIFVSSHLSHLLHSHSEGQKVYQLAYDFSKIIKPHSACLPARGYVASGNGVAGKLGLSAGYPVGALHVVSPCGQFAPPLSMQPIMATEDKDRVALQQIQSLFTQAELPFADTLCYLSMDAGFGKAKLLAPLYEQQNLVTICRLRTGMKVWTQYQNETPTGGAPRIYDQTFYLRHETRTIQTRNKQGQVLEKVQTSITELIAQQTIAYETQLANGRAVKVHIQVYENLLIRTKQGNSMKNKPFHLLYVRLIDSSTQEDVFDRPMFIAVSGQRRMEVAPLNAYQGYRFRFSVEHGYRFKNNNLMMSSFQTSVLNHLKNYLYIVEMAYWLLFIARQDITQLQCLPWQQYLPKNKAVQQAAKQDDETQTPKLSPAQVQKSLAALFYTFGNSYFLPQKRKKGLGRKAGTKLTQKARYPIVKKGKKNKKKNPKQLNC